MSPLVVAEKSDPTAADRSARLRRRRRAGFDKQLKAGSSADIIEDIAARFGIDPFDEVELGRLLESIAQDRPRSISADAIASLALAYPDLVEAANDERAMSDALDAIIEDYAEKIRDIHNRRVTPSRRDA